MEVKIVETVKKHISDLCFNMTFALNRITDQNWMINENKNAYHNLVFVYDGKGEFYNGKEKISVGEGDLVYFPVGGVKKMHTDINNPLKMYTVNFAAAYLYIENDEWKIEDVLFDFPFVKNVTEVKRSAFVGVFEKLCSLYVPDKCATTGRIDYGKEDETGIIELLNCDGIDEFIVCSHESETETLDDYAVNIGDVSCAGIIDDIQEYININYSNINLNVSTLSEIFEIDAKCLSRQYKIAVGEKLIDSINKRRLSMAKTLLKSNNGISEAAVAEKSGFGTVRNFIRVFKKHEGITPGQFRSKI